MTNFCQQCGTPTDTGFACPKGCRQHGNPELPPWEWGPDDPINWQAHAEALAEALERIASWPDGGNQYGQPHIKMFAAKALADYNQDRGKV